MAYEACVQDHERTCFSVYRNVRISECDFVCFTCFWKSRLSKFRCHFCFIKTTTTTLSLFVICKMDCTLRLDFWDREDQKNEHDMKKKKKKRRKKRKKKKKKYTNHTSYFLLSDF